MNEIAILSNRPPLPEVPAELAQQMARFDGMDLIRGTVPAVVVEQAKRHLQALDKHHAPAPDGVIEVWCRILRGGCAPIEEREFSGRLFAIRSVCGDLPAWVWTRDTLAKAWKTFKFFPTAHELFELADGIAQSGLLGRYQVKCLAEATPAHLLEPPENLVRLNISGERESRPTALNQILRGSDAD